MLAPLLFLITLLLCGAYAGMVLMCHIGVLPALRDLPLSAYADAWRAMDRYLARSMPPFKATLLLFNLATIGTLFVQHRQPLAAAAAVSFLCSVAGLLLTVRVQLPLNAQIAAMPAGTASPALPGILHSTVRGFTTRFYLAAAAFLALAIGIVFFPLA